MIQGLMATIRLTADIKVLGMLSLLKRQLRQLLLN